MSRQEKNKLFNVCEKGAGTGLPFLILRGQYESVALGLMKYLQMSGEGNEQERTERILESEALLGKLCRGIRRWVEREIEEAEEAYRQLLAQRIPVPFLEEKISSDVVRARAILAFLCETDDLIAQSLDMFNSWSKKTLTQRRLITAVTRVRRGFMML